MTMRKFALYAIPFLASTSAHAVDLVVDTERDRIHVSTFAEGLDHPWGLAFLPDGSALVTERKGNLRHIAREGELSEPIGGVPSVDAAGQGGLLDVALDPDFAGNRLVYLSFAEKGEGGNSTAVARGALSADNRTLEDVQVIFSQRPKVDGTAHFGSRLVFDKDGSLFVTMGERFRYDIREQAQQLDSHVGKIVRIRPDGGVPQNNPFADREGALPEIWSYGHRNIQAAAINPETGILWEIEHGPKGGDEINIIEAGGNYGWPVVSFGANYDGTPVGSGKEHAAGMIDPIYQWTPVIAPSGMLFYSGAAFPEWKGNLFVGALRETALVRLELDGNKVTHEEHLIDDLGQRIRDVQEGPDGALYLLTDHENGQVLRIEPADEAD